MKKYQTSRRQSVIDRLEKQLKDGNKTGKKGFVKVPLTDFDKKRINKEMTTLKSRV